MDDERPNWERWAKRLVDYYGRCSSEEKTAVAARLHTEYGNITFIIPKDLYLLEILWDFGGQSEHFSQLASLFHDLVGLHQKEMAVETFQNTIRLIKEMGVIDESAWGRYYVRRDVPGPLMQTRLQHAQHDAHMERRLLLEKKLPDDPDDMVHMLRKMRKKKMDFPNQPDFLLRIRERFSQLEQWPEIEKEFKKIESSENENIRSWLSTQIR